MSRRDHRDRRCERCVMHDTLCICDLIPSIPTRTRLLVLIHHTEERKPTNTGRLAVACLPNSVMSVRGRPGEPTPAFAYDEATQPVLLFPHESAVPIERFAKSERPVTLVVPDGNWRQASKVRNRVKGLAEIPCVSLQPDAPTEYRLRHETHPHGLATAEAIARAFGVLEGRHVREGIEHVLRVMVERTLWARGTLRTEDVTGGVPAAAIAAMAAMRPG